MSSKRPKKSSAASGIPTSNAFASLASSIAPDPPDPDEEKSAEQLLQQKQAAQRHALQQLRDK